MFFNKKKGTTEVTFDEELVVYITRKKRKPGRGSLETSRLACWRRIRLLFFRRG